MKRRDQHRLAVMALRTLSVLLSALRLTVLLLAAFLAGIVTTIQSYDLDLPSPVARLAESACASYAAPAETAARTGMAGKRFTERLEP